jgi:cell shape-determining protein MreC
MIQQGDQNIPLNNQQIVEIMKQQQGALQQQGGQLQQIKQAYEQLAKENMDLKNQLQSKDNTITELQKLNTQLLMKLSGSSSS